MHEGRLFLFPHLYDQHETLQKVKVLTESYFILQFHKTSTHKTTWYHARVNHQLVVPLNTNSYHVIVKNALYT